MYSVKSFISRSALAAALLMPAAAFAGPYSAIYVFGDSLVDGGNILAATGGTTPPAAAGYFQGRFTDGPTWVDRLNQTNSGALSNGFSTPGGGTNFAFGGARAVTNADAAPDLAFQVGAYLGSVAGAADSDALYIINIGGNDAFAISTGDTGGLNAVQYTTAMVGSILTRIQALTAAGARTFLVTGIPDVSGPPASNGIEPAARGLSMLLDGALQSALDGIEASLPAITLHRFSYINFGDQYLAQLTASGVPFITETSCLTGVGPSPNIDCSGYLYFDDIHPASSVHAAIARQVGAIVGVPEPESLALFGLGLAGLLAARRKRAA